MVEKDCSTPAEIFVPIAGEYSSYSVSSTGRVMRNRNASNASKSGTILKPIINSCGYVAYVLCLKGKHRHFMAHRLVSMAFIGHPTGDRIFVNHKDGVKTNNSVGNLEWCTSAENHHHASVNKLKAFGDRNGTRTMPERVARGERHSSRTHPEKIRRGESHPSAKITELDVLTIRSLRFSGRTLASIAAEFGVSQQLISAIHCMKVWAHVR